MLNFGGNIYPYTPYHLENVTDGITNTNDLSRAFYDIMVGTDSIRDRVGSLMSLINLLLMYLMLVLLLAKLDKIQA